MIDSKAGPEGRLRNLEAWLRTGGVAILGDSFVVKRLSTLMEILPTEEDRKAAAKFRGDVTTLGEPDSFMVHMCAPSAGPVTQRAGMLLAKMSFAEQVAASSAADALKTIDATIAQCEQSLAGLRDRGSGNLATAKTLQDRLAQMRTRRRAITDVVRREARVAEA